MSDTTGLSLNHFQLFELPVSFAIDMEQLTQRYREIQRTVHPDRYANGSDQERRLAMQRTAQLNEAFQVLKNPLSRARYMLELQGVDFNNERDTQQDPLFLMEQMELREALEELPAASDPLGVISQTLETIQAREKQLFAEIQTHLDSSGEQDQKAAKAIVHKLQFMHKLRQEAEDKEADLMDIL
ncbi:MAG: co-chaperone HscB [Gammaproteobacteria bacterium]